MARNPGEGRPIDAALRDLSLERVGRVARIRVVRLRSKVPPTPRPVSGIAREARYLHGAQQKQGELAPLLARLRRLSALVVVARRGEALVVA